MFLQKLKWILLYVKQLHYLPNGECQNQSGLRKTGESSNMKKHKMKLTSI